MKWTLEARQARDQECHIRAGTYRFISNLYKSFDNAARSMISPPDAWDRPELSNGTVFIALQVELHELFSPERFRAWVPFVLGWVPQEPLPFSPIRSKPISLRQLSDGKQRGEEAVLALTCDI